MIARTLIVEARKYPGGVLQMAERTRIPEIIAMVDPERAIEMIENQVLPAGPNLLTALAIARFEGDPRWALEIFDAIEQPERRRRFSPLSCLSAWGLQLRQSCDGNCSTGCGKPSGSRIPVRRRACWLGLLTAGSTSGTPSAVPSSSGKPRSWWKPRPANYLDPRANLAPGLRGSTSPRL